VGEERRQHVQGRRLPRARSPGDQDVQSPADTGVQQLHGLPGEGPERDQVVGPVRLGRELPGGQAGGGDRQRRERPAAPSAEPSGRRASTYGDDSSTRRPTLATILSMIRRSWPSSWNFAPVQYILPARST